jgi:hypothetical protein
MSPRYEQRINRVLFEFRCIPPEFWRIVISVLILWGMAEMWGAE